jgi:uncharacterized protein
MTHVTAYAPGTPSWVDLGTPDPAAACAFYGELFGWTFEEGPPEAGDYRMCLLGGKPVAGLGPQMNPDMPPWWMTYISVADADDASARITEAGGAIIVPPMDVLDVGRMAVASDSAGAVFSLWQPRAHIGAALVNEPNTLCWNELTTRAKDDSIRFYKAVFDWHPHAHGEGAGDYVEFHVADDAVCGLMPMVGEMWPADLPNHWMVYFATDDVDAAVERVVELGGSVAVGPTDIPPGRFAVVNDPHRAVFSLLTFRPEAA